MRKNYKANKMNVRLDKYSGKRICVAVSGGKDSMALLHYLTEHGNKYGITVSALNCDHGIRGKDSERDSAFVKAYCGGKGVPVYSFVAKNGLFKDENSARAWRLECYSKVLKEGKADVIATAHHMNDNAETVLFNLARGASLSGVCGISDEPSLGIIRPLIACSRDDIDGYINSNNVPYVTDESNFTQDYTRNKIRLNVLPALEQAVHGAVGAIYRFSRLAEEDEEYFSRKVDGIVARRFDGNYLIKPCGERVIFKRAAQRIISAYFRKCDYTAEMLETLYNLQSSDNGKKFEFLGLTAVKEDGGVAITEDSVLKAQEASFYDNLNDEKTIEFSGVLACAARGENAFDKINGKDLKTLSFDISAIPQNAVIRFRRTGDKFTKFGGGTVSLSDYLTDKKVPQSLRDKLPLVCVGSEVLIVGGVEISDKVKIKPDTEQKGVFICKNPFKYQ